MKEQERTYTRMLLLKPILWGKELATNYYPLKLYLIQNFRYIEQLSTSFFNTISGFPDFIPNFPDAICRPKFFKL